MIKTILLVFIAQLTLAKEVVKVAKSMSDSELKRLKLGNQDIRYQIETADSSDTPWDNPFDDNPDNDDDDCDNPEGCDGEVAEAAETCAIDIMSDSKTEIYMLAYGLIQGLYHSTNYPTETGCTRCVDFALPLANMQAGMVRLINFFALYVNKATYEDIPDFSGRLIMLFDAFIVFWNPSIHMSYFVHSETAMVLWKQLMGTVSTDFEGVFLNNVQMNFSSIYFLWQGL